nr:hypothetical protein [Deltaproteobacteria bacterium]
MGDNRAGQLGDGTTMTHATPVEVFGLRGVGSVALGEAHTCARLLDSTVRCWGSNLAGQLGDGTRTERLTPVAVPGLPEAVAITAGGSHTCALSGEGAVWCWGANNGGQLGDGSVDPRNAPIAVGDADGGDPLRNVVQVTAGFEHTCARLRDGTARCWGTGRDGQLGDGRVDGDSTRASVVPGLTDIVEIAAGGSHTCARQSGGAVLCWGANIAGELGDGTVDRRSRPTPVRGLGAASALTGGQSHTCALLVDGTARCWGYNRRGQLGDGTLDDRYVPTMVQSPGPIAQIAAGGGHTCARWSAAVRCWGTAGSGQLRRRPDRRAAPAHAGAWPRGRHCGGGGPRPHLRAQQRRHDALLG